MYIPIFEKKEPRNKVSITVLLSLSLRHVRHLDFQSTERLDYQPYVTVLSFRFPVGFVSFLFGCESRITENRIRRRTVVIDRRPTLLILRELIPIQVMVETRKFTVGAADVSGFQGNSLIYRPRLR